MKNKLLLTSALAGVVALAGSAVAETKVSGNLEYVMNNTSGATAATSSQGSGFEENIKITKVNPRIRENIHIGPINSCA